MAFAEYISHPYQLITSVNGRGNFERTQSQDANTCNTLKYIFLYFNILTMNTSYRYPLKKNMKEKI